MNFFSILKHFKELPKNAQILIGGAFVNAFGVVILPFISVILVKKLGFPPTSAGHVLAAIGGGAVTAVLTGGWLTDHFGRKPTMILSLTAGGLLCISISFIDRLVPMVCGLVLFSFVAELYRPASSAMLIDMLKSSERAMGFSAARVAVNLGFTGAMIVGGFLLDFNWKALFWFDGLTSLAYAVIVWRAIQNTHAKRREPARDSQGNELKEKHLLRQVWNDRPFLVALGVSFLSSSVYMTHIFNIPLTMANAGYPQRVFGLITSVNGLIVVLFQMQLVSALKSGRRMRAVFWGNFLIAVGLGVTGFYTHWSWYLGTLAVWSVGEILAMPMMSTFVADWSPPHLRGQYTGMFQSTWSIARSVSPLFLMPLYASVGDFWFYIYTALLLVPGLIGIIYLDRKADHVHLLRGRVT